jgi:hypothetical protein
VKSHLKELLRRGYINNKSIVPYKSEISHFYTK